MDYHIAPSLQPETGSKRPAGPSRGLYPRKRALLACQVCRKKKTKCDNVRPTCGSCRVLQCDCNYGDFNPDHSSYDHASLEILEQIGKMRQQLEFQNGQILRMLLSLPTAQYKTQPASVIDMLANDSTTESGTFPSSAPEKPLGLGYNHVPGDETILLSKSLEFRTSTSTSEHLLRWPIFESQYDSSQTEALIFCPEMGFEQQQTSAPLLNSMRSRPSMSTRGINDQDVPELVDKFISNVHIKNPIFNLDEITSMGKHIGEHGFEWNARSCFVLLVSALGCISSPFEPGNITVELMESINITSSIDDVSDYDTAKNYYNAARKRIGLLGYSILTAQCYLLSGIFEAYCLQPLRAWASFKEACITIQIYLKTRGRHGGSFDESLERRLYWSCLKSECELRMEIDLPPSGLAKVDYSNQFPSPPSLQGDMTDTSLFTTKLAHDSSSKIKRQLEQSWIYYLSDVSHRHISTRLVNMFYQDNAESWLSMPIDRMVNVAQELHLQLTQWYNHVPRINAEPESPHPDSVSDELQYLTDLRLIVLTERIYRPFLYLAIHLSPSDPAHQIITPYAKQCLEMCLKLARGGSHRHRHHGTWTQNRIIFNASIMILAAVKSRRLLIPDDWARVISFTITGLKFWEDEAPDLRKAREILMEMLVDVERIVSR